MSLLEKAKQVKVERKCKAGRYTLAELEELSLALLDNKIQAVQVTKALGINQSGNIYTFIWQGIKEAYRNGKIIIK